MSKGYKCSHCDFVAPISFATKQGEVKDGMELLVRHNKTRHRLCVPVRAGYMTFKMLTVEPKLSEMHDWDDTLGDLDTF
jgi:hypothetical protein